MVTIFWLDLIADECVSVAQALGLILKLSPAILGLTILAWGDSVGDLVANTAVARTGKTQAAITACFAAPLLSTVFGSALALGMYTVQHGPLQIHLNTHLLLGWIFLLIAVPVIIGAFAMNILPGLTGPPKWHGPRWLSWFLFFWYFAYMVLNIMNEANIFHLTHHDTDE